MDTIWVGEVEEKPLVYDPAIQLPGCPHLFLWDPADGTMGKYIADLIRKRIKPSRNLSEASIHIQAYQDWRGSSGDDWLASELSYYASRNQREAAEERARLERERIAAMTPAERHKERLEKLGKEYLGVRPAAPNPLRHRTTHCYACKESLDNSIDIECAACGWILCDCGACGCGYSGLV